MKKILTVVSAVILIPVVLIAGVIGFLKFADLNNYKHDIEKLVQKYASVDMKIKGNIDVGISLKPSLELTDVYISDMQGQKIVHIGNALVQMAVLPLLHKEIVVQKVQTDNTEIFYNEQDSVLINDLDAEAADYTSDVNISFDTIIAGTNILGHAKIDSLKQLKDNGYNQSAIKAQISALGYDLQYDGMVSGLQDNIQAQGKYEAVYKNSSISGNVDVNVENNIPYIKIDVNSQSINVEDWSVQTQASNSWFISDAYAEDFIPNTEIPYDYLRMVNADITIDVKQVKVDKDIILNDLKGDISLKDGVLKSNIENLKFKNNVLNGSAEITSPKSLPYIKLNIKGDGFDINEFTDVKKKDKKASIELDWLIGKANAAELAKDIKIPYQYLKMANADIDAKFKKISKGNDLILTNADVNINLQKGVLKSNTKNLEAGGGKINGSIYISSESKEMKANFKGKDIIAQELYKPFSQQNNQQLYIKQGGKINFDIDVTTSGNTVNGYLDNLGGHVIVFADNSVINIKSLEKMQGNILVQILDILKIKTSGKDMKLKCAVVRGDIQKGVITFPKGMAFDADSFYLVANGKINLQNDKINLDLQPFSGKITDVNISSILGNLIKVTGTISNPKIGINQTSTAKNVIGAIASGGAYNVGDLMLSADGAPCHTALKGTNYADYFKADNSIGGNISSGYNNTKDSIKDLGKGIKTQAKDLKNSAKELKNQFKGLFK